MKNKVNVPNGVSVFEIFKDEYLCIATDFSIKSSVQTETSVEMIESPFILSGFLTDENATHFFLGDQPDKYTRSISKDRVISLEVETPPAPVKKLSKAVIENSPGVN